MDTMNITLRGKTLSIPIELVKWCKDHFRPLTDERICIGRITCALTTGSFENGYSCPDIDQFIKNSTEEQVAEALIRGITMEKENFA